MVERISDAEHEIMEVLWKQAPLTATEVADQVVAANRQDTSFPSRSQSCCWYRTRWPPFSLFAAG